MLAIAVILVALAGSALCGFLLGLYLASGPVVLEWEDPMKDEQP